MKNDIIVIGSSNIDLIMKLPRLPKLGETVTDGSFLQTFGGKGANQAVGAARAGGKVAFVNCVGDDLYAQSLLDSLQKDGIDISAVFRETGIASGTALVMIGDEGKNYLSVAPGANYRLSKKHIDIVKPKIEEAEIIVLQFEIEEEVQKYIINVATELGKKILFNYAPARPFDLDYLKKISILIVNETEAEFITGNEVKNKKQALNALIKLHSMGPQKVILTLGAAGCLVSDTKEQRMIEGFAMKAVDTTAAGDIFCGALAVAIVEGKNLFDAAVFANAAAAISVTRLGAQPSAPTRNEIDAFLKDKAVLI